MMNDQWGVGNNKDAKAFSTVQVGGHYFDLIHGEHPHSRCDNNVYARRNDKIYEFDGHRIALKFEVETSNYLKSSYLSGDEIRKNCEFKIWINGEVCYTDWCREPLDALIKIHGVLYKILEHSSNYWGEDITGKRIFYDDVPAKIERMDRAEASIFIVPDGSENFPVPAWVIEDPEEDAEEWNASYGKGCKVSVFSDSIWWFRKDGTE